MYTNYNCSTNNDELSSRGRLAHALQTHGQRVRLPTGLVKAVAALASTCGGLDRAYAHLLPGASIPASIEKFNRVGVQLRHIPLLPRVILPASGALLAIQEYPTPLVQVLRNNLHQYVEYVLVSSATTA